MGQPKVTRPDIVNYAHDIDDMTAHNNVAVPNRETFVAIDSVGDVEYIPKDLVGGNSLIIPTPIFRGFRYKDNINPYYPRIDNLQVKWSSEYTKFLDYNPELWLFRYNNYEKIGISYSITTGIEQITNGNFTTTSDWTINNTGTSNNYISGGVLHLEEVTNQILAAKSDVALPIDKMYLVTCKLSSYTKGALQITVDGVSVMEIKTGTPTNLIIQNTIEQKGFIGVMFGSSAIVEFNLIDLGTGIELEIDYISVKEIDINYYQVRKKNWKHETHMNGIKYPNSNFYCGKTKAVPLDVSANGRHTEFDFNVIPDEWSDVPLNPFEFIRQVDGSGNMLTSTSDLSGFTSKLTFAKTKSGLEMRFGIVIDNPDNTSPFPKLIGNLSDSIAIRSQYTMISEVMTHRINYSKLWRGRSST